MTAALAKRTDRRRRGRAPQRNRIEVVWENPRGRGVILRRSEGGYEFERRVGPSDFLSLAEAAAVMDTYRMRLYRLVAAGEIKAQTVWGVQVVTLREVKRYMGMR
jgi:hypothetical protein